MAEKSTHDLLSVLYEDNHLLIINKQCGELVQADKTGDMSLMEKCRDYLKKKYNKPGNVFLGLPHRLDRPASGIVIYAKTSKALGRMTEIFRKREIRKIYWAVCCGNPPEEEGLIENFLLKNEKQNKSYIVPENRKGAKKSSLSYKWKGNSDRYSFLEVELHTGRHHQIRCQLAGTGCVIRGDLKYGAPRSNRNGGIDLLARKVIFTHPVSGKELGITAPVPDGPLWEMFEKTV